MDFAAAGSSRPSAQPPGLRLGLLPRWIRRIFPPSLMAAPQAVQTQFGIAAWNGIEASACANRSLFTARKF